MKFIETLFITKDPLKYSFGWAAPEYHLMSWALSSLQLHKIYQDIELYANSNAAKLLIDTLDLPYSKVNITHDNLNLVNESLWALPKLFTYSLQEEAFLHIDGDVFLFDKFPDSLLKNELIAQNIEEATNYYTSTQKELMANFSYFPDCVKTDFCSSIPIKGVNAGILGGSNISFFKEYTSTAFEYVNRNVQHFPYIIVDRFNIFFEQHLFYSLAKQKNIGISVLLNEVINDNEYKYMGNIHEAPCCKNYLHLLGHLKRDRFTCNQMAAKLRELYPEYYYKIIWLFKKSSALSLNFYQNKEFCFDDDFSNFTEEAKKVYHKNSEELNICDCVNEENDKTSFIEFLQEILTDHTQKTNSSVSEELQKDLKVFAKDLNKYLATINFSSYWLYGRDLESAGWYCELFGNESKIKSKMISRCCEIKIIESKFDWAGLLNKYTRVGVQYYDDLELSEGLFYNLVIPEVYGKKLSLFDLDEMEKIILDYLSVPCSINDLLIRMQSYVEKDVLLNHLEIFDNLILQFLKQLVVKKAVKPFSIKKAIEEFVPIL